MIISNKNPTKMIRILYWTLSLPIVFAVFTFTSCQSTKKVRERYVYFQKNLDSLGKPYFHELAIQPNDQISIFIYSKSLNQEQAAIFNMGGSSSGASSSTASGGASSGASSMSSGGAQNYQVGADGKIEMPILGIIQAAGRNIFQLQNEITDRVLPYVKDPSVIVRFTSFKVNMFGEFKSPGTKSFPVDKVTLLDAISAAGDLTEGGERRNVEVIREEKEGRKIYTVDLTSAGVFESPVFQLQQNDIVYALPNKARLKSLKEKPNLSAVQMGISLVSIISTLFLLIRNL